MTTSRLVEGQVHDLGDGFQVRRMLPVQPRCPVGPFVFFDHIGPSRFAAGSGMDVRPHPHIGLSTLTWLFEGAIRHRDSLGSAVDIRPDEVNWMTAGSGIAHSERTPPDERRQGQTLHGIQVWVALPRAEEERAPSFQHYDASALPVITRPGVRMTLIAGSAYEESSPVSVFSPMFFIEARLEPGATLAWPDEHVERGVYVVEGSISGDAASLHAGQMMVLTGDGAPSLRAEHGARLMLFGGAPLDGDRHLWWNFVSSRRERIEQAKADWQAERFGTVPDDEDEFIPLPPR